MTVRALWQHYDDRHRAEDDRLERIPGPVGEISPAGASESQSQRRSAPPAGDPVTESGARALPGDALTVVVLPGQLVNPGAGALELEPAGHVGQLVERLSEAVGAVLVSPAAAAWLGLPAEISAGHVQDHPFVAEAIAAGYDVDPGGLSWQLRVRRPAGGRAVPVVLLGYDTNGFCKPWSALEGVELVEGLAAFRSAVGASFGASIGQTGERLLLATHPKAKGGAQLQPSVMPPAIEHIAEPAAVWRRPLEAAELEKATHVHWFDANANYLGAYQVAVLGRGEPVRHRVDVDRLLSKYLPAGLWRAKLPELEAAMPAPWSTSAHWHTSPTIARARELGIDVEGLVVEAWIWPLQSRFTQPFGELMRDARARLLTDLEAPGTAPAAAAVTAVYQRLHGRFAAAFRANTTSPLWRPDWAQTIRAQARVNMDRRLRTLTAVPFCVDTDAAYFLADVAGAQDFAETIAPPDKPLLGPRAKVGAFRVKGSVVLTDQLRDRLTRAGSAATTRGVLEAALAGVDDERQVPKLEAPYRRPMPVELENMADDLAELAELLRGGE